jgi:hypothetical protein
LPVSPRVTSRPSTTRLPATSVGRSAAHAPPGAGGSAPSLVATGLGELEDQARPLEGQDDDARGRPARVRRAAPDERGAGDRRELERRARRVGLAGRGHHARAVPGEGPHLDRPGREDDPAGAARARGHAGGRGHEPRGRRRVRIGRPRQVDGAREGGVRLRAGVRERHDRRPGRQRAEGRGGLQERRGQGPARLGPALDRHTRHLVRDAPLDRRVGRELPAGARARTEEELGRQPGAHEDRVVDGRLAHPGGGRDLAERPQRGPGGAGRGHDLVHASGEGARCSRLALRLPQGVQAGDRARVRGAGPQRRVTGGEEGRDHGLDRVDARGPLGPPVLALEPHHDPRRGPVLVHVREARGPERGRDLPLPAVGGGHADCLLELGPAGLLPHPAQLLVAEPARGVDRPLGHLEEAGQGRLDAGRDPLHERAGRGPARGVEGLGRAGGRAREEDEGRRHRLVGLAVEVAVRAL